MPHPSGVSGTLSKCNQKYKFLSNMARFYNTRIILRRLYNRKKVYKNTLYTIESEVTILRDDFNICAHI